jgi:hypothetical protein
VFTVADHADFDFGTGDFTIAMWMRTSSAVSTVVMYNDTAWLNNNRWGFRMNVSTAHKMTFQIGNNDSVVSTTSLDDGAWHRIVVTREGTGATDMKMYIDGNTTPEDTGDGNEDLNNGTTLTIGGNSSTQCYDCDLDEIIIIKGTAWGTSDVTADYNSGSGVSYSPNATVTPSALALTFSQHAQTTIIETQPSALASTLGTTFIKSVATTGPTGGIRTKAIATRWPVTSGVTLGTRHYGRAINLVAEKGSLVPKRMKKGL